MHDYKHLDHDVLPQFELSDIDRADNMLLDRFFEHDRLAPILDYVDFLFAMPRQTRATGLIVWGSPGSGKTMLAKALLRRFPPQPAQPGQPQRLPVAGITMTGAREAKKLYERLLASMGVPDVGRYSGADRERMVLKVCREADLRVLIVDEVGDVLDSTERQQIIAINTIKFLMNELQLPIIALGVENAKKAVAVNPHLSARFLDFQLPTWSDDKYLKNLLKCLERRLPLKKPSMLASRPMIDELLKVSRGNLDRIMKSVLYAAAAAVESGTEQVTPEAVRYAILRPPVAVVRKHAAEAAAKALEMATGMAKAA
jgi:hypothetical protein